MIKIVILGGGNVAFHLTSNLLKVEEVEIVQVYNRNLDTIAHLKSKCAVTDDLNKLKDADIYIISVSDDVISEISSKLNFKNKLVVHTSGSIAMNDLQSKSNKGVFYPLQSFSKNSNIDFSTVPICLEAEIDEDLILLEKLGNLISNHIYYINSEQRKQLHVAAVFVNNFVNHLYKLGNDICNKNNVPFDILQPIIKETAQKITHLSPFEAQTGPAKRNDIKTIEKHKVMLTNNQQEIYTLLTKSIYKTYGEKL